METALEPTVSSTPTNAAKEEAPESSVARTLTGASTPTPPGGQPPLLAASPDEPSSPSAAAEGEGTPAAADFKVRNAPWRPVTFSY